MSDVYLPPEEQGAESVSGDADREKRLREAAAAAALAETHEKGGGTGGDKSGS